MKGFSFAAEQVILHLISCLAEPDSKSLSSKKFLPWDDDDG